MSDPTLINLKRRLERWELPHLRELAAELHAQVEALQLELQEVKRERDHAQDCADLYHDQMMSLHLECADALGGVPAITKGGDLHVIAQEMH